jgi:hypothetical protein
MRSNRRNNERVIFPVFNKAASSGQGFFIEFCIRRRKFENSFATDRSHAGFGSGAGDVVFKIIHVAKSCCSTPDHFGAGKFGSESDEFRRNKFAFYRHNITHKPHIEAKIIR